MPIEPNESVVPLDFLIDEWTKTLRHGREMHPGADPTTAPQAAWRLMQTAVGEGLADEPDEREMWLKNLEVVMTGMLAKRARRSLGEK